MDEVPAFSLMQTTTSPPSLPPSGPDLKRRAAGGTRRPLISNMMDTELLSPPWLRRRRLLRGCESRRHSAPSLPTFSAFSPVHPSAAPCPLPFVHASRHRGPEKEVEKPSCPQMQLLSTAGRQVGG